jgi:hypothetical protein
MRIATFAGVVVSMALSANVANAVQATLSFTLHDVDWTSAGVCGIPELGPNAGKGTIVLTGVTGTVTKALLYWHGIQGYAGSDAVYDNPIINMNTFSVVGTSLGDSATNGWGLNTSRTYRADVTPIVTGNGSYNLSGLNAQLGHSANGASLVVAFNDGNASNDRDLYILDGNDSNTGLYAGDPLGWHATLSGTYLAGTVNAQLHAADGQPQWGTLSNGAYYDNDVTFSIGSSFVTFPDTATRWDGISLPSAGGGRLGHGLWDIHAFNVSSIFGSSGTYTLNIDGQAPLANSGDALALIVALVDFPAASHITTPTPTPMPTPKVDHFTCWTTNNISGQQYSPIVSLEDRFSTSTAGVLPAKFLCAPTNKLNEDPEAPFHPEHLRWYPIHILSGTFTQKTINVVDQFHPNGVFVKILKPSVLLVPTVKSLSAPPALPDSFVTDHFQCYKGQFGNFVPVPGVTIQDQFGTTTVKVFHPLFFCPAVNKNHETPSAPKSDRALVCYKLQIAPGSMLTQAFINNQFGPASMYVRKRKLLCVPAHDNPMAPPTPTKTPHGPPKTATPTRTATPTPQASPTDKCHGDTSEGRCVVLEWKDPAWCTCAPQPCTGGQCVCTFGHLCGACVGDETCIDFGCRSICATDPMIVSCQDNSDCGADQLCISASDICP